MQPIVAYLNDQIFHDNKEEAYKLRRRATQFIFLDDILYNRDFSSGLLQCVGGKEATYILREINEWVRGNHFEGLVLAQKILRQGYYWPTLKKDAIRFAKKCQVLTLFPIQRQPFQELTVVSSPWPFAKQGMNLIGPLTKKKGSASFIIIVIDYFTKWVQAEPLAKITEANASNFLQKKIICRFGIPHSIVSDNGRQSENKKVKTYAMRWESKSTFPHHIIPPLMDRSRL